jgi:hypothetical protein
MPANELNRDKHEFTHNGANYWIYTFMTRDGYCTTASGARWMRDRRERAKPEPISSSGSRSSWTIRRHVYGKVLSDVGERHKRNNRPRRPRGRLSFGSPILKKEQSEERTRDLFLIAMTVSAWFRDRTANVALMPDASEPNPLSQAFTNSPSTCVYYSLLFGLLADADAAVMRSCMDETRPSTASVKSRDISATIPGTDR